MKLRFRLLSRGHAAEQVLVPPEYMKRLGQ